MIDFLCTHLARPSFNLTFLICLGSTVSSWSSQLAGPAKKILNADTRYSTSYRFSYLRVRCNRDCYATRRSVWALPGGAHKPVTVEIKTGGCM